MAFPLSGIPAKHWQRYIKIFADGAQDAANRPRPCQQSQRAVVAAGADADKIASVDALLAAVKGNRRPD